MDERKFYRKDSGFITTHNIELRYIHIILSNSIIPTGEENTEVKERDIYIMRCMRNHKHQLHMSYHILRRLKNVADDEKNNHVITVGNFVTMTARYHNMGLGSEKKVFGLPSLT